MLRLLTTLTILSVCLPANSQEPLIVAHRGASRDAPENTIPAFQLAWEQGADAIEGDFHKTRDGEIVCIHQTKVLDQTKRAIRYCMSLIFSTRKTAN